MPRASRICRLAVASTPMAAHDEMPTTRLEAAFAATGSRCVAGIDEVGRGALGGPVVAAAVVLPLDLQLACERLAAVRDSKALTCRQRLECAASIVCTARAIGLGQVQPIEIDMLGVRVATELAVTRALDALPCRADLVLVDGVPMPTLRIRQHAVIKGDRSVLSIAAASVVAKVHRDAMMIRLSGNGPAYGWHENKGYGAPAHLRALTMLGPTTEHRLSWAPIAWIGQIGRPRRTRLSQLAAAAGAPSSDALHDDYDRGCTTPWERTNPARVVWSVQCALDAEASAS